MARARSPPSRCATCSAWPTAAASGGCLQLVLAGDAGRGARRARRGARARDRPDAAAARADGGAPLGDPGQGRSDRRRAAIGRGTRSRRRRWRGSCRGARIHRLWQMLLKGLQDVDVAPDPREAAEMALLRLIHAADMPDPAALMARLSGEGSAPRQPGAGAGEPTAPTAAAAGGFPGAGQAARSERQASACGPAPRPGRAGPLRAARAGAEADAAARRAIGRATSRRRSRRRPAPAGRWRFPTRPGEPSLLDQEKIAEERVRAEVLADPNVRAVMDAFPDAELEILFHERR